MKKKNRYIAVAVLCVVLAAAFCGTAFAAFGAPAPREGSYYGLVNKSVTVPQYEEGVTVTSPSGKAVSLLSGGRFIATEEGIYTVRYSDGSAASVRVFATAPDVEFAFSYELAGDYGIGKRIVLPSAAIGSEGSGWSIGYDTYDIAVYHNDRLLQTLNSENRTFVFPGAGAFRFVYSTKDVFGNDAKREIGTLATDKIVLNYEEVPDILPFRKSYNFGEVQVVKNGVTGNVSVRVEKPDGTSEVLQGTAFTPMQYGKYKVIFSGNVAGESIEERAEFEVAVTASGLFTASAGILSVTDGVEYPSYAMKDHDGNTKSGVEFITESTGASIEFNNIIDLNRFGRGDDLIRFQALDGDGFYKMSAVDIYLTDAHNPNNTVRVNYQRSLNESNSPEGNRKFGPNVLVGYSGTNTLIGLGVPDESVEGFVYDASLGWVSAGTCISDGAFNGASKADNSVLDFNLRFDLQEKQVWVESRDVTDLLHDPTCAVHDGCPRPDHHCPGDAGYHNVLESEYHTGRAWKDYKVKAKNCGEVDEYGMRSHIVRDLDDDYKDNQVGDSFQCVDRLWNGFTTGEVYMKIVLSGVNGRSGIIVSEIAGIDLGGTRIEDTTDPVIGFGRGYEFFAEEETRPYGIKGEEFPLPEFSVTDDISAACATEISVKGPSSENVPIADNSFVPQAAGIYTIVVKAEDESGNSAVRTVTVEVIESPSYSFENEPSSNTLQIEEAWIVPEVVVTGMSGIASAEAVVRYNGKEIAVEYGEELVLYLSEEGTLEYDIVWTDYLGKQTEKHYDIPVAMHGVYVRIDGVPATAETGQSIVIPDFTAIDATQEPRRDMQKSIKVTSSRGTETLGADGVYVCPDTPQLITVEYYVDGVLYEVGGQPYVKQINVVNVKYHPTEGAGNIVDYFFVPAGMSAAANDTSVVFSAEADGAFSMPYPVVADRLNIELATTARGGMSYFDIVLTDYYNEKLSVFLRVSKAADGSAVMTVNGEGEQYPTGAMFASGEPQKNILSLTLDTARNAVCNRSGIVMASLNRYDNGTSFLGFTEGILRLSFRFGGVSGRAELGIRQIGNQVFNASITQTDSDQNGGQGPQIAYEKKMDNERIKPGTEIVIPRAKAYDVLYGGESEVRVTVTDPKGNTVLRNALANETRSIVCSEYGYYRVAFSAINKFQPKVTETYRIYVLDETPAVLNVNGEIANEFSVGSTLTVPDASATDRGAEVEVFVFFVKDYYYKPIETGDLVLDKAGKYSIVYVAYDAEGNATRQAFSFEVR